MTQLSGRERTVLTMTVQRHVRTGEPVGSRWLAAHLELEVSPATVRNTMADLEERGYLRQTHVSSGRIPTDRGYRYYVDEVVTVQPAPPSGVEDLRERLGRGGEITGLIRETSRALSSASRQVGLVLVPRLGEARLEHLELRRVSHRRVLAIFVSESRLVLTRLLDLAEDWAQEDLDAMSRIWNERYAGLRLPEVRATLEALIAEERAALDTLAARVLELGCQALAGHDPHEELYLDGAANILDVPEFAEPAKLRALVEAIEEKDRLCRLLDQCLRAERVQVYIGGEVPLPGLDNLSLVTAPYRREGRVVGALGVIGPTRMAYERIIPLVAGAAQSLSECLSRD